MGTPADLVGLAIVVAAVVATAAAAAIVVVAAATDQETVLDQGTAAPNPRLA